MKFYKQFLVFLTMFACSMAYPKTVDHNPKRLIEIIGVMTNNAVEAAFRIDYLSRKSNEPIHIFLNSPGGSTFAGMIMVDAMTAAKSRGVKFICSSGILSASMAYSILVNCDERYVLRNTKLLFHPVRAMIQAALRAEDAKALFEELDREGAWLKEDVYSHMPKGISREWFDKHYALETLWTSSVLDKEPGMKGYFVIVDDIKGVKSPFNLGQPDQPEEQEQQQKENEQKQRQERVERLKRELEEAKKVEVK